MNQKISLIVTILNEEKTLASLLSSIAAQTFKPDEVIITDGGSKDATLDVLKQWQKSHSSLNLKILSKKGNRSIGRNLAIEETRNELIAITDAGCVAHKNWLEKLVHHYEQTKAPVIAGYYESKPQTPFEEAVVPYVLVMPDRVDPETFLPATRSMLIEKNVWEIVGGFDETLSDNEDYAFAKKIQAHDFRIVFAQNAVVTWSPRSDLSSFAQMIFRFARGDMKAGIVRPKVMMIFVRYIFVVISSIMLLTQDVKLALSYWVLGLVLYSLWAITKNAQYTPKGWYWLPVLQIVSDVEVMRGSVRGFLQKT